MGAHGRCRGLSTICLGAVLAAGAAVVIGQTPSPIDPTRREAARLTAAKNALALPLRERALRAAPRLGLSAEDRFEVVSAHRDARGQTHVRLQQYLHGIRVVGGRLIAHGEGPGGLPDYSDAVVRGISAPISPRLSAVQAIGRVEADSRRRGAFAVPPTTELVYLPIFEPVLVSDPTKPIPPRQYDPDVEHAMVESINSDDVGRRLVRTHLAWRVVAVDRDAGRGSFASREWFVDAIDGSVVAVRELDSRATGTGTGSWDPDGNGKPVAYPVSFQTRSVGGCFRMEDTIRKFKTETEDFGSGHEVNCDNNDRWGNGKDFAGDENASTTNWQTAMVDGHFGATVYWEMMDEVFGFQGPDDDFYSVNVFVHSDTDWDNCKYYWLSGNIACGDGPEDGGGTSRTRLDCFGHELGHAWNDHNTGYPSGFALNESLADVFGEWTKAYLRSGGFAARSSQIGSIDDTNWKNNCSGRNLMDPAKSGNPRYWYPGILDDGEHYGSLPASRAFTFLARGASSANDSPSYSRKLPWGMTGIGLQAAAEVFLLAHRSFVSGDDYSALRTGMIQAAVSRGQDETRAVQNAYAAINVGSSAAGTPEPPPVTAEEEPNDGQAQRQVLGQGTNPPAGGLPGSPRKIVVVGSTGQGDEDWYRVTLTGKTLRVLLTPIAPLSQSAGLGVQIWVPNDTTPGPGVPPSHDPQLVQSTVFFVPSGPYNRLVRVFRSPGASGPAFYRLDIDLTVD